VAWFLGDLISEATTGKSLSENTGNFIDNFAKRLYMAHHGFVY
jgi:hypothetical protein